MRYVDIYTHPGCPGGDAATHYLDKRGIPYRIHNVAHDADAQEQMRFWGCRETPVLVLGERILRRFEPEVIECWWQDAPS